MGRLGRSVGPNTNIGVVLVGNWCRAPDEPFDSISSLAEELNSSEDTFVGMIIVGDLNIHHKSWLFHSNANTRASESLMGICQDFSLSQLVRHPTRGDYLLDLVLSDMKDLVKVFVLPDLSDHKVVCVDLDVIVVKQSAISRQVWDFKHAQWDNLNSSLRSTSWQSFLDNAAPDASVGASCKHLIALCSQFIPRKTLFAQKRNHPWIDDDCLYVR